MTRLAVAVLAISFVPITAHAEDRAARDAALYLYGALAVGIATLNACREADPDNMPVYAAVVGQIVSENRATFDRIDVVLEGEATRSGLAATTFLQMYPTIAAAAAEAAKQDRAADLLEFLENCRAMPEAAQHHVGYFQPLRNGYPMQMRLIDEWR